MAKTIKQTVTGWFGKKGEAEVKQELRKAESVYGYDAVSVSMLLGSGRRQSRHRVTILEKLHYMMGDPIISAALKLHVTNALGGDPRTGNKIFIEPSTLTKDSKENQRIADEIKTDLEDMFNKIAFQICYNAAGFGDAYARPYCKDKEGIIGIYTEEMVWPPLVQPYEKAGTTVGFTVAIGQEFTERLTLKQMVRMKMQRLGYVAQNNVIDKAVKMTLMNDDIEEMPLQPALVGGSFLFEAEEPYDNLQTALVGMIGQRILSSIDENMMTYNAEGMTKDQKDEFKKNLATMLEKSKKRAEDAIKSGEPSLQRYFHVIPTHSEKQVTQISQFQGTSGSSSFNIDDVMFHLKRLTGAIGIDLSLLGFSDLLSGGLGEGGFFRTSAQAAEMSQRIRTSASDFFYDMIDLHCLYKYGNVFDKMDRPYKVNFYGSISALEGETQAQKERSMNSTMLMGQALSGLKDLGLTTDTIKVILTEEMQMDSDLAEKIAKDMERKPEDNPDGEQ